MGEQEIKKEERIMSDKDMYFAMIGAVLIQELSASRELRRKISGTMLEKKLTNALDSSSGAILYIFRLLITFLFDHKKNIYI